MNEVNITPFDNEISILYKWARRYRTPIRLVLVDNVIRGDQEITIYTNGIQKIQDLFQEGYNLNQIYQTLHDKIETEDISMIYALNKMVKNDPMLPVVEEINGIYLLENLEIIQDVQELGLILADWRSRIGTELENDMNDLEDLETIHNELGKYQEVLYSPIKVEHVTIKAKPTLKSTGLSPTPEDGVIIFNDSSLSYDIPSLRYNGSGGNRKELFKLYRGLTDEVMPNYKIIIPPSSKTNKDSSFYFTVWTGKGTLSKATKESYLNGSYDLNQNLLTIKTPTEEDINQQTIIKKIEKSLPININDVTETAISGEFFLFDLEINDIYMVDMVINTELMSSYLFVKETNTPYAEKKQLKLYYKSFAGFVEEEEKANDGYIVNPASVTVSLTQNRAHGGEIVQVMTKEGPTKFRLPHGLPYIRAKITQAESLEVANQFAKIFSRLMQYYKTKKPEIEQLFTGFIPELKPREKVEGVEPLHITVKQPTGKKGAGDSKIERLKEVAPDLFVNGYARKCQCNLQPLAIPPDEIASWQNKTFIYRDAVRQRQVMSFPPNNPQWNFVCPNDSAPFPGVKINKELSNKDIYPYFPCCFKDDQMDPQVNSKYNEYFKGRMKKEEKAPTKETHKIKTDKILNTGRYGYLPKGISDLTSKYSEEAVDMIRMGVPHTVNSLLHCVSLAIQDPSYLKLITPDDKEKYVSNLRQIITKQTIPNLLKQEMYDYSTLEITEQLGNNNLFLDPNLFYRAIEESYNINIYVFAPPDKDDNLSLGTFEIPRFKLFHARSPRPERRAVLIFRTIGSESDSLDYPQCELIIDRDEDNNKNVLNFGPEMNTLLHNALTTLNKTITWELNRNTQIIARENIYSRENYYYLLNKLPSKQIIDGYGKVQAFIMPISETDEMTIIIPSSQPENLPTGEVTRVSVENVISIFGEPRAVTKDNQGLVDGLWYQVLDLEYGIYVPVVPTDQYTTIETGPSNPLVEEGIEVVQRIRKIKRDLETILQLLIWLFIVSGMEVNDFINKYVSIGTDPVQDSAKVYDLSKIKLKLPTINNVEEGIGYLNGVAPTLIRMDRMFLYTQKFFDGILYYLNKYNIERKPKNPKIPTVIYRSDISEEDFTPQRRVAIFTDESDMRTWMNSLDKLSFKNIIIENELNISNALLSEPYLYSAPTGNIYMIQNVMGGNRSRALNVSYNWYLNKVNLGNTAPEFDNENVPVHVIYGISPALAPIVIENHAGESTQYLQILSYGSEQYAAMLPLL